MKNWLKKLYLKIREQNGYTLTELSISTSIIAMLAVGGLAIMQKKNASDRVKETVYKLEKIQTALKGYIRTNKELPCPAGPALPESNTLFGQKVGYNATDKICDNDTNDDGIGDSDIDVSGSPPDANDILTNGVGAVPVRTLNLPDDMAYDGWGRKFAYRITDSAGDQADFEAPGFLGDIAIVDRQGTHKTNINDPAPYNDGAIYVVISYGSNGKNVAWRRNNTTAPSATMQATGVEKTNTDHTRKVYVQAARTESFDDIVIYGIKSQLLAPKNISSPIQITKQTCENARGMVTNGLSHASLNAFDLHSGSTSGHKALIFKAAQILEKMCDNEPSSATNPSHISGLTLWLDADDASTLFEDSNCTNNPEPDDGDNIGCWKDKSGNANDATASTTLLEPTYKTGIINNKPVIRFDGTQALQTDNFSLGPFTVFAVIESSQTGTNLIYEFGSTSTDDGAMYLNTDKNYTISKNVGTSRSGLNIAATNWLNAEGNEVITSHIFSSSHASHKLYIDGVSQSLSNNTGNDDDNPGTDEKSLELNIGSRNNSTLFYNGDIAELIIYNRALSDGERGKIEAYLAEKWSITLGSTATNYCSNGMTWQKTTDYPEGTCLCPTGQKLVHNLETNDACLFSANSTFSKCFTPGTSPDYANQSPALTPPSGTGQVLWLDANDCTTITLSTGDTVSTWADKSSKNEDVIQATLANRPTYVTNVKNSLPVIRFDGTDGLYNTSFQDFTTMTAFVVGTYNSGDTTQTMLDISDGLATDKGLTFFYDTTVSTVRAFDGATKDVTHTETLPVTNIFAATIDGTNLTYHVNGAQKPKTATGNLSGNTQARVDVGQLMTAVDATRLNGDIGEVIVYNFALSNKERETIEEYLATKWDIDRIPSDISGLNLWLDANDLSEIYEDTCSPTGTLSNHNQPVACWEDKSGNGNDATQTSVTTSLRPTLQLAALNGLPVVRFDGVDDYLDTASFNWGTNFSIFVVANMNTNSTNAYTRIIETDHRSHFYLGRDNTNDNYQFIVNNNSSPFGTAITGDLADGNYDIITAIYDGTTGTIYENGTAAQTSSFTLPTSSSFVLKVGGRYDDAATFNWHGDIAEIIIYNTNLTSTQQTNIENYLSSKWNITLP